MIIRSNVCCQNNLVIGKGQLDYKTNFFHYVKRSK
jgi:hypothetical protein